MDALTVVLLVAATFAVVEPAVVTYVGAVWGPRRARASVREDIEWARVQTLTDVKAMIEESQSRIVGDVRLALPDWRQPAHDLAPVIDERVRLALYGPPADDGSVGGAIADLTRLVSATLDQKLGPLTADEPRLTSDAASELGLRSAMAKQERDAVKAVSEANIIGEVGPVVWDAVKGMFPELAEKALRHPHLSRKILTPLLAAVKPNGATGGRGGR